MAALVAAIHFPETERYLHCFWKIDGRDKPGHDGIGYVTCNRSQSFPLPLREERG